MAAELSHLLSVDQKKHKYLRSLLFIQSCVEPFSVPSGIRSTVWLADSTWIWVVNNHTKPPWLWKLLRKLLHYLTKIILHTSPPSCLPTPRQPSIYAKKLCLTKIPGQRAIRAMAEGKKINSIRLGKTIHTMKCLLIRNCCIFWPAFGCCALQTLVEMAFFSIYCAKKLKKARNLQQNYAKHIFLKFAPKCWSTVLFPKNWSNEFVWSINDKQNFL